MLLIFLRTSDEALKYTNMQIKYPDNCIHHYNVEISNLFDPELQLINTKSIIKKAKEKEINRNNIS